MRISISEKLLEKIASSKAVYVISIEGNIGAGKSTLCGRLEKFLNSVGIPTKTVQEPLDTWKQMNVLQTMYSDPRASYECQTMFFVTRVMSTLSVIKANQDARVILLDRSWLTDRIFMETLEALSAVTETQMKWYKTWYTFWISQVPLLYCREMMPRSVLYLRCSPENAKLRTDARKREEEKSISLEYLSLLHRKHDDAFKTEEGEYRLKPFYSEYLQSCGHSLNVGAAQIEESSVKVIAIDGDSVDLKCSVTEIPAVSMLVKDIEEFFMQN